MYGVEQISILENIGITFIMKTKTVRSLSNLFCCQFEFARVLAVDSTVQPPPGGPREHPDIKQKYIMFLFLIH